MLLESDPEAKLLLGADIIFLCTIILDKDIDGVFHEIYYGRVGLKGNLTGKAVSV